jgi:hypothetical protein
VADLSWLDKLSDKDKAALLAQAEAELSRNQLADYRPYPKQMEFLREPAAASWFRVSTTPSMQAARPWPALVTQLGPRVQGPAA